MSEEKALVSIKIKGTGESVELNTPEEVVEFVQADHAFWRPIVGVFHSGIHQQLWPNGQTAINTLDNAMSLAAKMQQGDEASVSNNAAAVQSHLSKLYLEFGLIPHNTIRGEFLKQLVEVGDHIEAAGAFYWLSRKPFRFLPHGQSLSSEFLHGIARAIAYELSLVVRLETEDEVQGSYASKMRERVDDVEHWIIDAQDEYAKTLHNHCNEYDKIIEDSETTAAKLRDMLSRVESEWDTEREKVIRSFEGFTRLKGPIDYWKRRRAFSYSMFGVWLAAFVLTIAGVIWVVYCKWGNIPTNLTFQSINPVYLAASALGVTVFLILLRMFSRMAMSAYHIAIDSSERVVMGYTYMAMLYQDKIKAEDHAHIIFETIFRPTPTGLIKEDTVSPAVMDVINRTLSGKASGN